MGGTCGNVLIFLMPGALLVEYAASKARTSRQRRQLAAELEGPLAGAEVGAGAPGAPPPYRLWTSKLFWAGVLLLAISAGLFVLTFVTTFSPPAAATS